MGWTGQYFTTIIIQGNNAGVFIYNGAPAGGTLIGSWAAQAGTDAFGNAYPAGINVQQGSLVGVSLSSAAMISSTIMSTLISASQIQSSQITGGTMYETTITFDSGGGGLFMYSSTTTATTFLTSGIYTPPSTGTARVQCWSASGGSSGGTTTKGGGGGGGGGYGEEPQYPVLSGVGLSVNVGQGGSGGITNQNGTDGGQTNFDGNNIQVNAGQAGIGSSGGAGGNAPGATISRSGGQGGTASSTGGAGGGAAAGSSNNGAAGTSNAGTGSVAGGTGTNGGGNGGASGAATANGSTGVQPGGGGGGAGAANATSTINKSYSPIQTSSYYGSEVGQGRRNNNGGMYQGCAQGFINTTGDQYSIALYNQALINSDFSGASISSVSVVIKNSHSWYNAGQFLVMGYAAFGSLGGTGNLAGAHLNQSAPWINQGVTTTFNTPWLKSVVGTNNFSCVILGPSKSTTGGATDLYNYGIENGGPSFGPVLKISGTVGAGSATGGDGNDGKVIVTQSTSSVLIAAASPIATTDSAGNAVAAGWTGPTRAFQPGSNPTVVEGWHTIAGATGLTGTIRCKYIAEANMVMLDVSVSWTTTTGATFVLGSLPSAAYYPTVFGNSGGSRIYPLGSNTVPSAVAAGPRVFVPSSGALQILVPAATTAGTNDSCTVIWPVD